MLFLQSISGRIMLEASCFCVIHLSGICAS